ncbi:unannotated protein [freshwater metagenome]|uniref:Unannotated protein n=1 Tax=freshwater metagenome TaxID=449393 RepID=A0A6J7CUQ0_9ZZZZ
MSRERLRAPCRNACAYEWPDQFFEPSALGRIGERAARYRSSVDDSRGSDLWTPALDDRLANLRSVIELVNDGVRREGLGAEALERGERG